MKYKIYSPISLIKYLTVTIALFLFICGCTKKNKDTDEGAAPEESKSLAEMQPGDVIVAINNYKLTKSDYNEMLAKTERSFRLRQPNVASGLVTMYLRGKEKTIVNEYINRCLLLGEAQRRAIKIPDQELRSSISNSVKKIKAEGKTLDQVLAHMGESKEQFESMLSERLQINALLAQEFGENHQVVTAEDLEAQRESYVKYNELCAATNQLVMARGKRLMEQLNSGADFDTVALATSEEKDITTAYWGEFNRLEIDDEKVREAAFNMPIGSVAGPFDTEDGMVIIKILKRSDPKATEGEAGEAVVHLGRIFLRMGQSFDCPNDKELKIEILRERQDQKLAPFLEKLRQDAVVKFPCGTNLWPVVKQTGSTP